MNVKIAVVYNGEPKLCKAVKDRPDIYVPILAGSVWNKRKFDIPNLLYDDVGDNISWLNPYINECTAIYWLGRHLDMLGDPDYVGLNHYRRLFHLDDVLPHLAPDVLVLNPEKVMLPTVDFLELCHGVGRYLTSLSDRVLDKNDQEIQTLFSWFVFSQTYFSRNLFVVPKDVLINLVDNMQILLANIAQDIDFDMIGTPFARNIGFVMERMIGFYFLTLIKRNGYKLHPTMFYYVNEEELK